MVLPMSCPLDYDPSSAATDVEETNIWQNFIGSPGYGTLGRL